MHPTTKEAPVRADKPAKASLSGPLSVMAFLK